MFRRFSWMVFILAVFAACSDTTSNTAVPTRPETSRETMTVPAPTPTSAATPAAPGEWISIAPMNVGRTDYSSVTLDDGRVLVVGGLGATGTLRSVEIFDLESGEWTVVADTIHPRRHVVLVKLSDGTVIAAGGQQGQTVSTTELYDPEADAWTELPNLNVGRQSGMGVALDDGRALVFGGGNGVVGGHDGQFELRSAEIYDPATNEWTLIEPIQQGETDWSGWTELIDGRVLLAGGDFARPNRFMQVFDPETDSWSKSEALDSPIGGAAAALLPDGRVLLAGGGLRCCLTDTLIFDPSAETWSDGPEMPVARGGHKGIALPDGRLLLLFGLNPDRPFDGLYRDGHVYDPASSQWLRTGAYPGLLTAASMPLALSDGTVFLAGGRRTFLGPSGDIEVEFLADSYLLQVP